MRDSAGKEQFEKNADTIFLIKNDSLIFYISGGAQSASGCDAQEKGLAARIVALAKIASCFTTQQQMLITMGPPIYFLASRM